MKLIKAHVENFGKLHDFDYDFSDGLNSFIQENGWGKTTFTVFIKSMLYGMEFIRGGGLEKNERKKYFPWQGGTYGGKLSFSHNGKNYQIIRKFGEKKGTDKFELYDLSTNKLSDDFSENLGEEIFGINRDTYQRSVYIVLGETPEGSSDISAKLNGLVEAADVSNFDDAVSKLESMAKSLKAQRGSGGEINEIQNKIREDNEKISDIEGKIRQNKLYIEENSKLQAEIKNLENTQDMLTERLSLNAKYESKLHYEQLKNDAKAALAQKNALLDFFNGKLPDEKSVQNTDLILRNYLTVESNLRNNPVTQAEKDRYESLKNLFHGDIPTKDEIDSCLKTDGEYNVFKREENGKKLSPQEKTDFDIYRAKFSGADISEEKIQGCLSLMQDVQDKNQKISDLGNLLQNKKMELEKLRLVKNTNIKRIIFLSLFALFAATGIALPVIDFADFMILGIAGGVLSVLFLVLGIVSKAKKEDDTELVQEIENLEKEISGQKSKNSKNEQNYKNFILKFAPDEKSDIASLNKISNEYNIYENLLRKYNDYETWLASKTKKPSEYEAELRQFLKRFCGTEDISAVSVTIQSLNERLNKLSELENKINSTSRNKEILAEEKEKLASVLLQFKTDKSLGFSEQVQQIHDKLNDFKNAEMLLAQSSKKVSDFEQNLEFDISSFGNLKKPEKSTEELKSELSGITEKINGKNTLSLDYQKSIDNNQADIDKKEDIESEIDRLSSQKKEKEEQHQILTKTKEFLQKAKDKLDANYSEPMKNSFEKYLGLLGNNLNLIIDTDLKISVEGNGEYHESGTLSEGYKDLVNFCARMALIDSLFKESQPTVILDDPFVNLDDEKVPRALNLIKNMAEKRQILYFACHKSRMVK